MIEKKNEYVLRNFKIVSSLICFQIEERWGVQTRLTRACYCLQVERVLLSIAGFHRISPSAHNILLRTLCDWLVNLHHPLNQSSAKLNQLRLGHSRFPAL